MSIDYGNRLSRLRVRRSGETAGNISLNSALMKTEHYERRTATTATRYALGSMQEVDPDYTRVGIEESDRVKEQLRSGLNDVSTYAYYRLQGSLPLNVHIRGVSDVDMLVLLGPWLTYDRSGSRANSYGSYVGQGVLYDVIALRTNCEDILKRRYWGANVDTSGDKSIKLSGGSFRRDVDVVPSHWNDTSTYQITGNEADRGVGILDKSVPEIIQNLPFLHIAKIEEKDRVTSGGAKRAIRLLKNLKADTDRDIALSSYDIASLMWHCEDHLIAVQPWHELSVLAGTDAHLARLAADYEYASSLRTPDNTRRIINEVSKFSSLVALSQEVSALADAVLAEQRTVSPQILAKQDSVRQMLRETILAD